MKKILFTLFVFCIYLHAEIIDGDLDGVANEDDLCPNSKLTEIVDSKGCAIKNLTFKEDDHFDISVGYTYLKEDDNYSQQLQSLSIDYYYKNFSIWLYSSKYNSQNIENSFDDLTVGVYHRWSYPSYGIKAGLGSYIPYNSNSGNKTDYFVMIKGIKYVKQYNFIAEYQYTLMYDNSTQNSNRLTLSIGYNLTSKSYTSVSYSEQTSVYKDEKNINNTTLYYSHFWNSHWFITGEILKGLSSSSVDYSTSLSIGYYF